MSYFWKFDYFFVLTCFFSLDVLKVDCTTYILSPYIVFFSLIKRNIFGFIFVHQFQRFALLFQIISVYRLCNSLIINRPYFFIWLIDKLLSIKLLITNLISIILHHRRFQLKNFLALHRWLQINLRFWIVVSLIHNWSIF